MQFQADLNTAQPQITNPRLATEVTKRLFDIAIAVFGCALVIVLVPFIWIYNLLFDHGTTFYLQERVGLYNKPLTLVKFRTMTCAANGSDEPTVTKFGRFLRKTHLDELPQFWNILKGDMSFVGPRPERPHLVKLFSAEIPSYHQRHLAKPGLTGWAQVHYRHGVTVEDTQYRLQYDLNYVNNQTLAFDLMIVIMTFIELFRFRGR